MRFRYHITGKKIAKFVLVHGAFLIAVILYSYTVGCLLNRLTGITCPGCGLSRAYLACLRLDFAAAFAYHPLFPLLPPYILYILWHHIFHFPGSKKLTVVLTVVMAVLLVGVWLIRLGLQDPVVAFHTEDSLVTKIFPHLVGRQ